MTVPPTVAVTVWPDTEPFVMHRRRPLKVLLVDGAHALNVLAWLDLGGEDGRVSSGSGTGCCWEQNVGCTHELKV